RSPTSRMPPSGRPCAAAARSPSADPPARASRTSASVPGAACRSVPRMRATALEAYGATAKTFVRPASAPLRRRRKTIPPSSSASRPTSTTLVADSRSAKVTSMLFAATACARNCASSAECARARWSTSFVPSTTRANFAYAYASSSVSRPPGSTPTPPAARAAARPCAAASSASDQLAGRSSPREPSSPRSRTSGWVRRSGAFCHVNAKRSLSVIHSSLTTGSSPARRRGDCTARADLERIAREVRGETATRQVEARVADRGVALAREHVGVEGADLLERTALLQVDERDPRNLVGEARAALAQDAPLAVEQDLRRDRQRLGVAPLGVDEARLLAPVAHRLVLQRAIFTLVAPVAYERA